MAGIDLPRSVRARCFPSIFRGSLLLGSYSSPFIRSLPFPIPGNGPSPFRLVRQLAHQHSGARPRIPSACLPKTVSERCLNTADRTRPQFPGLPERPFELLVARILNLVCSSFAWQMGSGLKLGCLGARSSRGLGVFLSTRQSSAHLFCASGPQKPYELLNWGHLGHNSTYVWGPGMCFS